MFFSTKKVLGLDIGTSSLKLAEMEVSRKGARLTRFVVEPIRGDLVSGGEILDSANLAPYIQSAFRKSSSKRNHISVGIWGSAVIVKKITLPKMDLSLIPEQLRFEAEQYIPFDLNEINLEFHVLSKSKTQETMEVILVGAKRDLVFRYAEAVELAGLQCSIVDVSGFALGNCYRTSYGARKGETLGLLNVGGGITSFVVVSDGEVIFSRDIMVGGGNFTSEIQKNMSISAEEAEALKISYSEGQASPEDVDGIMQATMETVCDEIKRTFDFYNATGGEDQIQRILITGGACVTRGLRESISAILELPVEMFNPFLGISYEASAFNTAMLKKVQTIGAVAMGLGMRTLGDR